MATLRNLSHSPQLFNSKTSMSTLASDRSELAEAASLGEQLAREMRQRWRRGERPTAEEYLAQFPELRQSAEAAIDVIYEEFCLRQAAGETDVANDVLRRFPEWRAPLQVMLDCHRVLQATDRVPVFPVVGDTVGDFRLIADVGSGARGRVYLATQSELAGRPVVLKITPLDSTEHLLLARLQHTHIVPVYSVADDAARSIRILVMPYFGRATLASLLIKLADVPLEQRTGQHILAALDELNQSADEAAPTAAAPRQMLSHVTYVQAACWITACLADALQYAHEHNLVHLDVKPSNVLLASDGQPMLLDFHLAREPIRDGASLPDRLGGTPGYMPPEQEAAMQALSSGQPIASPVDGRADLYALGAILCELLADTPALKPEAQAKPGWQETSLARQASMNNPHVSAGLAGIVAKCLAPLADDRYASAAELADDLRRHLTDQPLVGAPNRSWSERWQKWRRRHRNAVRSVGMLTVVMVALALLLAGAWSQFRQRSADAEQALREGESQLQNHQPAIAAATFQRGLSLIENVPLRPELLQKLREQLASAKRLGRADQLHQLADQIRVLFGSDSVPAARLRPLANLCDEFWSQRSQVVASLNAERDSEIATDLLDVAIFAADVPVRLASAADAPAARQAALRTLDEAESLFGHSPVLDYQRRVYRGDRDAADLESISARRTVWDHYALGRALLNANQLEPAAEELRAAVTIAPSSLWPNFYFGVCAHRLGQHDQAVAAFSVCIGAAPRLSACFHNRALAHAALGNTAAAHRDKQQARELDPTRADFDDTSRGDD